MIFVAKPQVQIGDRGLAKIGLQRAGNVPGQGDDVAHMAGEINRAVD